MIIKCNLDRLRMSTKSVITECPRTLVIAKSMQSIDTRTKPMALKLFILILYRYVKLMPSICNYCTMQEREREKVCVECVRAYVRVCVCVTINNLLLLT